MNLDWEMTKKELSYAGWYAGRRVPVNMNLPSPLVVFAAADKILSEFGGLRLGNHTEKTIFAENIAKEMVVDLFKCINSSGRQLLPVALREHQDIEYFLVDPRGTIYLLADRLMTYASSIEVALMRIISMCERREDVVEELKTAGIEYREWEVAEEEN